MVTIRKFFGKITSTTSTAISSGYLREFCEKASSKNYKFRIIRGRDRETNLLMQMRSKFLRVSIMTEQDYKVTNTTGEKN